MLRYLFFFNDTATTEIYTLSLHDALPIFAETLLADLPSFGVEVMDAFTPVPLAAADPMLGPIAGNQDRKSTRLNSSHANISYAVFCLKKKNINSCSPYLTITRNRLLQTIR